MPPAKNRSYYAYAHNEHGANVPIGYAQSQRELKDRARKEMGKGWIISIFKIIYNDNSEVIERTLVETFKLRGVSTN